jgi:hypothetical protein
MPPASRWIRISAEIPDAEISPSSCGRLAFRIKNSANEQPAMTMATNNIKRRMIRFTDDVPAIINLVK